MSRTEEDVGGELSVVILYYAEFEIEVEMEEY